MYNFFQNKECEYFPCHDITSKNLDNSHFNCLFCFCPLYFCDCGGNFFILPNGIKDCSNCLIPHIKDIGYDRICNKIKEFNTK